MQYPRFTVKQLQRVTVFFIARLMPIWIVVFSLIAFHWQQQFSSWSHATGTALGVVMFIMGLMLDQTRIQQILKSPWQAILGSLGKWGIAPAVSVALAAAFFGLHSELSNGVIMAGVVPSGTSANLNALIGQGDLSLSVAMSALDTVIGPLITPALSKWFAGSGVHMAYLPFVLKTARIVFVPLVLGIMAKRLWPAVQEKLRPVAPILSALTLYVVVLGVVAPASQTLLTHASSLIPIFACAILQILSQMGLGYLYARAIRFGDSAARSMVFEVGICNTALAAVLATSAFGPLAGVAAMANMVCNLTIGSLAAVVLAAIPLREFATHHRQGQWRHVASPEQQDAV